jgi:uncharacterized surface protein with fasciclin (FAS1) repeats
VLSAKPNSAVKVLADGSQALTAFPPTDRAFRRLVADLTGKRPRTERATYRRLVAAAGVDAIEKVLLYQVVPGATITSARARQSDGAALSTAAGATVTVNVRGRGRIALQDKDRRRERRDPAGRQERQPGQPPDRARGLPGAAPGRPLSTRLTAQR